MTALRSLALSVASADAHAGRTPWHGLGTTFTAAPASASEALKTAGLNWQVNQESVYDADMHELPQYRINRREDTKEVLGIVSSTWTPIQNERLLEIAEALVQVDSTGFRPSIEVAGSVRGGRLVWALVQTGVRTFAGFAHKSYLLLSNGHEGTRALKGTLTDIRTVCSNALNTAERAAQLFVHHGRGVETRVQNALATLGWANDATNATFAIYAALEAARIDTDRAVKYFTKLTRPEADEATEEATKRAKQTVDEMVTLFHTGAGNSGSSAFDALNAVTDWVDHKKHYRDTGNVTERRFLYSTLGGEGDRLKRTAFRQARQLAASL